MKATVFHDIDIILMETSYYQLIYTERLQIWEYDLGSQSDRSLR